MATHHAAPFDEPDRPPVTAIAVTVGSTFAFVFVCLPVALLVLWKMTIVDEKRIDVGMADPRRLAYIQTKEAVLAAEAPLQGGRVQIPISQAMELVVKQQGSLNKN